MSAPYAEIGEIRSATCQYCGRHIEQVDGDRWRHMYPYWDHMLSCEPKLRRDPQIHTMAEPAAEGLG